MSPFIVTTKRPDQPRGALRVATLEEALRKAHDFVLGAEIEAGGGVGSARMDGRFDVFYDQAHAISGSGGTVGPLPDGTTIQVEPVLWSVLAEDVGVELRWDPPTQGYDYLHAAQREELEAVLVAWNAKHGQA